MNTIHRRASLGLAISGPFSRNRRRRRRPLRARLHECRHFALAAVLLAFLATFGFFLFR